MSHPASHVFITLALGIGASGCRMPQCALDDGYMIAEQVKPAPVVPPHADIAGLAPFVSYFRVTSVGPAQRYVLVRWRCEERIEPELQCRYWPDSDPDHQVVMALSHAGDRLDLHSFSVSMRPVS